MCAACVTNSSFNFGDFDSAQPQTESRCNAVNTVQIVGNKIGRDMFIVSQGCIPSR